MTVLRLTQDETERLPDAPLPRSPLDEWWDSRGVHARGTAT